MMALGFLEDHARKLEANRDLESATTLPDGPANGINSQCLNPASLPVVTNYIESGVQADEEPWIDNSEDTEISNKLAHKYYDTFFPKFRSLLPISAQTKYSKNRQGMLPPLHTLTTAQVELLCFSVANNFAGLHDFPHELMWDYMRQHISISRLLQFSPGPTTAALAENLFQCIVECGDVKAAEFLLEKRYVNASKQVCIVGGARYTPVERSAKLRYITMTRLLVHYQANVNKTHVEYEDAEHGALERAVSLFGDASEPPLELIHILLESGASITVRVLERALYKLYLQVAEVLIHKGANDHHTEWTQRGIFLYALKQFDVETATRIVELMLRTKANIAHSVTDDHKTLNKFLWPIFSPSSVLDMAAEKGYLKVVRILLECGVRITDATLMCAIRSTNMELVRYLLHQGVSVDTVATLFRFPDKSRFRSHLSDDPLEYTLRTPYSEAIRSRNTQLIRLLKEKGALCHIHQDSEFKAALFAAAEFGNLEIVRSLIRDVRGKGTVLGCALLKACAAGHEKVAQVLIAAGADTNARSENHSDGGSSLANALERKMAGLAQLLLNTGANPNGTNDDRMVRGKKLPLEIAVERGDIYLIKDLLLAGAHVDQTADYREGSQLSRAIRNKNTEVIHLLLDNGADISYFSTDDKGPLAAAIESGVIEMIDFLLERGADPANEEALLRAMSQSIDLVQRLLRSFSERYPYGKGRYGLRALSRAVREQNLPLVQALLHANIPVDGSPIWHDSRKNATPLAIAIEGDELAMVEILLNKVVDLNRIVRFDVYDQEIRDRQTALLVAVSAGNPQIVQLLISRGANVNLAARGGIERTPLQMAAEKGHLAMIQLLIEKGAEVNARPAMKGGATALQLAAIGGYIGVAEELLRQGASINAPGSDISGRTALEGAAEHGRIDMVQYLLNAGAEITGSGYCQYAMAMQYAKENGHRAISELLESAAASYREVLTLE
jgi:ankyrin repeat protein